MTAVHAIFRADGSTTIGIGHVQRCLALALGLRERGIGVTFLTSSGAPVEDLVRPHGVEALTVPAAETSSEAVRTIEVAAQRAAAVAVTDICYGAALGRGSYVADYHRLIRGRLFTIAFVGYDVRDLDADVIVSPYVGSASSRHTRTDRVYLDGPAYAVLRPEFGRFIRIPRAIADRPRRILVTMGGGDAPGLTTCALAAIALLRDQDLETRVIVGPAYPPAVVTGAHDVADELLGSCVFLPHGADLAEQMFWADVAIIGDGLTKYETAATGTPSVILASAGSDSELGARFESAGTAVLVRNANEQTPREVADRIRSLMEDVQARTRMSRNGRALVDGRAVDRLSALISDAARGRADNGSRLVLG